MASLPNRTPVLEVFRSAKAGTPSFYWRLRAANGEIIATSEPFTRRSDAVRAAERAKVLMVEATVEVIA